MAGTCSSHDKENTPPGCPEVDSTRKKKRRQTARHMENDCGGGEELDRKDLVWAQLACPRFIHPYAKDD